MLGPTARPVIVFLSCLLWSSGSLAQTTQLETPLSVIDWLGSQTAPRITRPSIRPKPHRFEPSVAQTATAPEVSVKPIGVGSPRSIGLVPMAVTGLPLSLWAGSDVKQAAARIAALPDITLPAAQSLLYTVLLAEAQAPQGLASAGDELALARVHKLMDLGAIDPALSLIEQAGVKTSSAHFDLWMQLSLLAGTEDRACEVLALAPHLTHDYGTRIFCTARQGEWENAALTFGSAQALGLMSNEKLALFDRFLNPDLFEGAAPLPVPRQMDPLTFRLFETIGESLPTQRLPRAYAVADLRDLAGWKAQLSAAERLTRYGALPDNRLLGFYTDHEPAASGGIWDRVEALQRFETALQQRSPEAISKTLPAAWLAMREADLATPFATLFSEQLINFKLFGRSRQIAFEVILLSAQYELAVPASASNESRFLMEVARGAPSRPLPDHPNAAAITASFDSATTNSPLIKAAKAGKLGETLLQTIEIMQQGFDGDNLKLHDALSALRTLGLEDTSRRAALQNILLRRKN